MNFLKKIFSPSCLIISLFLFIYVFYKSEIIWIGSKNSFYFSYYVFSLTLIFFSIISFFINKKIKEYLIIVLISVVGCFYIFESYLTYKIYNQSVLNKKKRTL